MKPCFDISKFQSEINAIAARGNAALQLMERSGYPAERIEKEREALRRDALGARMAISQCFQEELSTILRDAGLS